MSKSYKPEEIKTEEKQNNNLSKANDFTVLNNAGEKVSLSDFFGKPIVVNFWATWCTPCKMELPEFEEAHKDYGKEIEFLMVNLTDEYNEPIESVKTFTKENNYTFPVYFDTEYSATNTYRIYSIPRTLFINKDGEIVKSYTGMINKETLDMYIKKLRGE